MCIIFQCSGLGSGYAIENYPVGKDLILGRRLFLEVQDTKFVTMCEILVL